MTQISFTSPLEPDLATRRAYWAQVIDLILAGDARVQAGAVAPPVDAQQLRARIAQINLSEGNDLATLLPEVVDLLVDGLVHITHPRYFGLFNPSSAFLGQIADLLTASFNPQMAVWSHAPAAIEMEQAALRLMASGLGVPSAYGTFTSGGAEANATSLLLALTRHFPIIGEHGVRALPGNPVFYASQESHLAWLKIAHMAGLGRNAVRLVPVDDNLQMDVTALRQMIARDRQAGHLPFLIVATIGTTAAGIIDPTPALATLAETEGLHLHVDAAWAGAIALSDQLRSWLVGCERADSITVDAHKWLSVPMGAGMIFTPHVEALQSTFRVATSYMPSADAMDYYVTTMQWSRRFIGLKLFLTLAGIGQAGYAAQLEHDVWLGDQLRQQLRMHGWQIINRTPLPVVCFVEPTREGDVTYHQRLCAHLVESGCAWLSNVRLMGRPALRACITSFRTQPEDVEILLAGLAKARQSSRDYAPA